MKSINWRFAFWNWFKKPNINVTFLFVVVIAAGVYVSVVNWGWLSKQENYNPLSVIFAGLVAFAAIVSAFIAIYNKLKKPNRKEIEKEFIGGLKGKLGGGTETVGDEQFLEEARTAIRELDDRKMYEALKALQSGDHSKTFNALQQIAEEEHGSIAANQAYRWLGALAFLTDTNRSLNAYRKAVELDSEDTEGWNMLGLLLRRTGKHKEAIEAFQKVEEIGEEENKAEDLAIALGNLGFVYRKLGELDKAEDYQNRSLLIELDQKRPHGIGANLGNLGLIMFARERLNEAEMFLSKALSFFIVSGDHEAVASVIGNLGMVFFGRGERGWPLAKHFFEKALQLSEKKFPGIECSNLGNLGLLSRVTGDVDKAEEYHRRSLEIARKLGMREAEGQQLGNLGLVYRDRKKKREACNYFRLALEIFTDIDIPVEIERTQQALEETGCNSSSHDS